MSNGSATAPRRMRVYLCGPINGRSDDDCKGWRECNKSAIKAAKLIANSQRAEG